MKIKFIGKKEHEEEVKENLSKGNYEFVTQDETFYLTEKSFNRDSLVGKLNEDYLYDDSRQEFLIIRPDKIEQYSIKFPLFWLCD